MINLKNIILLALLSSAFCACTKNQNAVAVLRYYRDDASVNKISRVVFVEIHEDTGYPDIAKRMTLNLASKLSDRCKFHVDIVNETHSDLQDIDLTKREAYTLAELARIRKALRCDAILFGKLQRYNPYPRHSVGLHLRLVDLRDGKVIWAIDDVWDATDKSVAKRIDNYYFDEKDKQFAPVNSEYAMMSTNAFQDFISYEISRTMDPADRGDSSKKIYWIRPAKRFGTGFLNGAKDFLQDF